MMLFMPGRRLALAALLAVTAGVVGIASPVTPAWAAEETMTITLKNGSVTVRLRPDLAPKHVERVKQLVKDRYYDGVVFHRVIEGFMAQTGDHTGTGRGGSKYGTLQAEFTNTPFKRGTIGAARTRDPNSANSQFFICFNNTGCQHLKGQYTVWGEVVDGMEHVDKIARANGTGNPKPDAMITVRLDAEPQG